MRSRTPAVAVRTTTAATPRVRARPVTISGSVRRRHRAPRRALRPAPGARTAESVVTRGAAGAGLGPRAPTHHGGGAPTAPPPGGGRERAHARKGPPRGRVGNR